MKIPFCTWTSYICEPNTLAVISRSAVKAITDRYSFSDAPKCSIRTQFRFVCSCRAISSCRALNLVCTWCPSGTIVPLSAGCCWLHQVVGSTVLPSSTVLTLFNWEEFNLVTERPRRAFLWFCSADGTVESSGTWPSISVIESARRT